MLQSAYTSQHIGNDSYNQSQVPEISQLISLFIIGISHNMIHKDSFEYYTTYLVERNTNKNHYNNCMKLILHLIPTVGV